MMRILLFVATNLAVLVIASISLSLLGVPSYLQNNGMDIDLQSLLIFCAVFGFTGSFISLLLSKPMAKMGTRTYVIEQPRNHAEQWLLETVRDLSQKAGIKMPEVGIFPSPVSNAFATGWNKNAALVAVSEGLLHRFDKEEVRAVLAHEIGHVANGDMVTLALIQGVMNTFVMFVSRVVAHILNQFLRNDEGEGGLGQIGYFAVVMVLDMVFGILASIIVMWFSRRREYRADEAGARLAGTGAMIAALQRLKAESEVPVQMPDSLTAFGINGGLKHGLAGLFMTHPPLDDRIEALRALR